MNISRQLAAEYGMEALSIIETGEYVSPSGVVIQIGEQINNAVQDSVTYSPSTVVSGTRRQRKSIDIGVVNSPSLAVARNLISAGFNPVVLNFASGTSPGGGFLRGANAQEEYLVRSSALFACLNGNPTYKYNKTRNDPLYSDYVIYSPKVPVFRSDDGSLLEIPDLISFVTSPAVNASRLAPDRIAEAIPTMKGRIQKVLAVGRYHGHNSIILGAWGCGAFDNNVMEIAHLFKLVIREKYRGSYNKIVFAVLDRTSDQSYYGPFSDVFS